MYLSIYLSTYLPYRSTSIFIYPPTFLSTNRTTYLPIRYRFVGGDKQEVAATPAADAGAAPAAPAAPPAEVGR